MIRFFRKWRFDLIGKNQTGKYLKYAIGEIALVMIGILLALQVNNWKTKTVNKQIEHDYYCQLLDDLNLDKAQLDTLTRQTNNSVTRGKQLIMDLNAMTKDKDALLTEYLKAVRSVAYVPINAAYTDLKSSGKLGLLHDIQLKKALITYYSEIEALQQTLQANRAFRIQKMMADWEDVLEFGWQSPGISGNLQLDEELLSLLPHNEWQLDKDNPYFRQFQEVIFISITISAREAELYELIQQKMAPLYQELEAACQDNN